MFEEVEDLDRSETITTEHSHDSRDSSSRGKPWNPLSDEDFIKRTKKDYELYNLEMDLHLTEMKVQGKVCCCQVDPKFPANDSSLYYSKRPYRFFFGLEWKRPQDIIALPKLVEDGATTSDIKQGALGDCWFLAAVASIAREERFINKVLPLGQGDSSAASLGYYYVRFWKFGEWVSVIINDKLPTKNGHFAFGRCTSESEIWLSLVEKAFASLHGSYEAIDGGFSIEALEDLTGGLAIQYELEDAHPNLFNRILKAFKNDIFMACTYRQNQAKRGLIALHAYTVTAAHKIPFRGSIIELIRIRNPYGDDEWTGDWSDSSPLWDEIDDYSKKKIGYVNKTEGQFWMSYEDFKIYFGNIKLCSISRDIGDERGEIGKWISCQMKGTWIENEASHRQEFVEYAKNPQYLLQLLHPDDFDPEFDDPGDKGRCSIAIGLMQEDKRRLRKNGHKNFYISMNIFRVDRKPASKLGPKFFRDSFKKSISTGKYINKREVVLMEKFHSGYYILVPSRFHRNDGGEFLIRVFSEKGVILQQLK